MMKMHITRKYQDTTIKLMKHYLYCGTTVLLFNNFIFLLNNTTTTCQKNLLNENEVFIDTTSSTIP